MTYKRIFAISLSIILIVEVLKSQNTLIIKDKSGNKTSFYIDEVYNFTFLDGLFNINKNDKTITIYKVENIKSIYFTESEKKAEWSNKLLLFHDHTQNKLEVRFQSTTDEIAHLYIFDSHAKLRVEKILHLQIGLNYNSITLNHLESGLYFCFIQSSNLYIKGKVIVQ